jgi:hypothetical protein
MEKINEYFNNIDNILQYLKDNAKDDKMKMHVDALKIWSNKIYKDLEENCHVIRKCRCCCDED